MSVEDDILNFSNTSEMYQQILQFEESIYHQVAGTKKVKVITFPMPNGIDLESEELQVLQKEAEELGEVLLFQIECKGYTLLIPSKQQDKIGIIKDSIDETRYPN